MAEGLDLAQLSDGLGRLAGQAETWTAVTFTPDHLYAWLLAYWSVLQVVLIVTAVIIMLSSVDDLVIDILYWRLALAEHARRLWRKPAPQARLLRHPEKRIAVMVPAWQEAEVIAAMAANTVNTFDYDAFDIFVGVYANDPDTAREVASIEGRFPNVHRAEVPHAGPTSKADCLNWIVQNILAYETAHGVTFEVFVMHDAEDVVHPFGLRTVNWFIEEQGMIQLPVLSMNRRWRRLIACHYMDEFAEFHGKDLRVRSEVAEMTPSAGVATAFSREAMLALCREKNNRPFNTDSLTEDYDVGHRLKAMGFGSRFVRYFAKTLRYRKAWLRKGQVQVLRKEIVATREFFPDRWTASVRQKARWMLGISYMGWRQLGWFGDFANRYFLFRDRKALITAPTGALAYLIVLQYLGFIGVTLVFPQAASLPPLVEDAWVWAIIQINFVFLLNRLLHRFWFTWRYHGLRYAWLSPFRVVVSNLIGFFAFARSLRIFVGHAVTGRTIAWDKTTHAFPTLAQIAHRRGLTGDVLRFWNHVDVAELDSALDAQKARYRPIGLLLLDRGATTDEQLAQAFAETHDAGMTVIDALALPAEALALLGPREAGRFAAVPFRREGATAHLALAEPLSRDDRLELERRLGQRGASDIRYLYAPLGDVAFAARFAWEPAGTAQARAAVDDLVARGLIDAAGAIRLWRGVRQRYARLGDLLVRSGALEHRALVGAIAGQPSDQRLGEHLVARGLIGQEALGRCLAMQSVGPEVVRARAVDLALIEPDHPDGGGAPGPDATSTALRLEPV
jgi:adsorption protein B